MGIHDSTKTRVCPVFDALFRMDASGETWLPRLLKLPAQNGENALPKLENLAISKRYYGSAAEEKKLQPPLALLSWLIRNPDPKRKAYLSGAEPTVIARTNLFGGDQAQIEEALALLRSNPLNKKWHIFEGLTQPDVYIETPSAIVIVEGKRTEAGPTTKTTWMEARPQMLRHLDCAWEIRGRKEVIGFFIVEGDKAGKGVPSVWRIEAAKTIEPDVVKASLPHRGPEEQQAIADCYLGITTWQDVCDEFSLQPTLLKESV